MPVLRFKRYRHYADEIIRGARCVPEASFIFYE